jgi:hypothetical protein
MYASVWVQRFNVDNTVVINSDIISTEKAWRLFDMSKICCVCRQCGSRQYGCRQLGCRQKSVATQTGLRTSAGDQVRNLAIPVDTRIQS